MPSNKDNKASELISRMKDDIREIINKYANECSSLASNSVDPHTPVITFAQICLANASVDYLALCGCQPLEAFQNTVTVTGVAMQHWTQTVLRRHGLKAEVSTEKTVVAPNEAKPN